MKTSLRLKFKRFLIDLLGLYNAYEITFFLQRLRSGKKKKEYPFSLFEVTGIETEYMIVDRDTLDIKSISPKLLTGENGELTPSYCNGSITWSHETTSHLIELKVSEPVQNLLDAAASFYKNILEINNILDKYNAVLMPASVHPWLKPADTEYFNTSKLTKLGKVFNLQRHSWVNLQSTQINFPFKNNDEFGRLHAAMRLVLPIIPALCASSPVMDAKFTGFLDGRMKNLEELEFTTVRGKIIPETAYSKKMYYKKIYTPIMKEIRRVAADGEVEFWFPSWRGAIAKFDKGSIEIRIPDSQECPKSDIAIVEAIVATVKMLTLKQPIPCSQQKRWTVDALFNIYSECIRYGEMATIRNADYLKIWGINKQEIPACEVWRTILNSIKEDISNESWQVLMYINENGTLATRILNSLNGDFSLPALRLTYAKLVNCLQTNELLKG